MAYAAVNSLLYTVEHILNSPRISFASLTQQFLDFALDRVKNLQRTLREFNHIKNCSHGVMASDARIRDEARKLEDAIEFLASSQFLSQSQNLLFSLNLEALSQHLDCFTKTADEMEEEYVQELHKHNPSTEADALSVSLSPPNDSDCEMVGLSDLFRKIKNLLISKGSKRHTISIGGMAGIGKTTLAKNIFHNESMKANFECRAFVTVGRKYNLEEILRSVLSQVSLRKEGEFGDLQERLKRNLSGKKYLIVLDDTWDLDFYLEFKCALANEDNGSRILLTSRKTRVVERDVRNADSFTMRLLDEEESWELLKLKVFGNEDYPRQLMKAGKRIARNCQGLPLLIVTVAEKLHQRNLEYWNEVAEKKNSVFEDSCDQISEVLIQSYQYMKQYLKLCFLYIAVFPHDYVVRRSRIVKLWRAEGFLEHSGNYAIDKLASYNIVLVCEKCFVRDRVHAFRLHPAYWHMCKKEGENNKFLCVLSTYADSSIQRLKNQRCFAIYKNVLFAVKEVHDSIASVMNARSLLCTGPYHRYQVPVCLGLRLLRVLDALTIRFYEFPVEVSKLIQLRYLALTCDANLPRSISKLWRLKYLIVHPHMSIKWSLQESYLPIEIWDLQELRHLEIMGRNLPEPRKGAVLSNLTKLLNVGVQSCTKRVLERIPNLRKLRIQIELSPDADQTLSWSDHVSCLDNLESVQSVVVDPLVCEPTDEVVLVPSPPHPVSVSNIKKLSLSGFGYAWEDMRKVGELPHLRVLKLRCYAFRGDKWEVREREFSTLGYLLIEDTDLVQWTAEEGSFARIWHLTMKNCYNLQEIPLFTSCRDYEISSTINIQLVDCEPSAEICAKQKYNAERVSAIYSWK